MGGDGAGRGGFDGWVGLTLLLVGIGLTVAYVAHPGGTFTRGGLVHADGLYHYAWLRSWAVGGDFSLADDYAVLGDPHAYAGGGAGPVGNPFSIGAALGWLPTYAVARVISGGLDPAAAMVQRITLFGSVIWAWAALALTARVARDHAGPRATSLAVLLLAVATPLGWYATRQPSWPHATSAFTVALVVAHLQRTAGRDDMVRWIVAGALCGLAAMVHPIAAPIVVLPVGTCFVRSASTLGRRFVAAGLIVVAALVAFSPQLWVWHALYGSALTVPQGPDFVRFGHSQWVETLWSSRAGLFAWSPVVGLSIVGLCLAAVAPRSRRLAAGLLGVFAITAWLAGAADDWWGGHAFGGRRLVALSVAYGVGLAAGADRLLRSQRHLLVRVAVLLVALTSVRLHTTLARDYMHGRVDRGTPISFEPVMSRAFGPAGATMHRWIGNLGAVPASWLFALRHGVAPARWDTTVGWTLVRSKARERGWDRLDVTDARWALRGFAEPRYLRAHRCRPLADSTVTVAVPLRAPLALRARARFHADGEGARVRIAVGSVTVGQRDLRPGWHDETWTIPRTATHAGINLLKLERSGDPAVCWAWLDLLEEDAQGPPQP